MFQLTTHDHHRLATTSGLKRLTGRAPAAFALLCSVALLPLAAQADGLRVLLCRGWVRQRLTSTTSTQASTDFRSEAPSRSRTTGSYSRATPTRVMADSTSRTTAAGVGYAWSVADTTDLYGKLSYVRAEADIEGFSLDDDGYAVALGVRSLFGERFELEASVDYSDLSLSGDDTNFGVGARWYFVKHFALGIEASYQATTPPFSEPT